MKRIVEIGNWPPPVCGWSMSMVGLRRELESRGWECRVMNLNENRRAKSPEYIDVQNGPDYLGKIVRCARDGCAIHVRANAESLDVYILAFLALLVARIWRRPALLTYAGGHQQTHFPAPRWSLKNLAFGLLFRMAHQIYCNSEAVRNRILAAGANENCVFALPHTSPHYLQFTPSPLPADMEDFYSRHQSVYFLYICFRKEYELEFVAEAIRRFRSQFPGAGFFFVGPGKNELSSMREFLRRQKIDDAVFLSGSLPHELFLNLLSRSTAYIRIPLTDGVCSSVLESLKLKIPVFAADNGTRPAGVELWQARDLEGLMDLMTKGVQDRPDLVARIPEFTIEDNTKKLADKIEEFCSSRLTRREAEEGIAGHSTGF